MPNTTRHDAQDKLRAELERLGRLDWSVSPAILQAIQALVAAMDYADQTLIRSHLETVFEALNDLVRDIIRKLLGQRQLVMECWANARDILNGGPLESYDEVGKELESLFDTQLKAMSGFRDGPVQILETSGHEVENASDLRDAIQELQKLRDGIFEDWPWSSQALPPVNRKMVAESRAAIAQGKGERVQDLITRLGGDHAMKE